MPINEIRADLTGCQGRYAIVAVKFNQFITDRLIIAAVDTLSTYGIPETDIDCVWVPGAFEIPLAASVLAESGEYQAIITLGAVIRGETPHFDYVAGECAAGITRINNNSYTPVIFGVLTTDTTEQAIERAGGNTNKGYEAAIAALEMASIMDQIVKS